MDIAPEPDSRGAPFGPDGRVKLGARDEWVLQLLVERGLLAVIQAQALVRWWASRRTGDAGLLEFLVEAGYFLPGAVRVVDLLTRGYLSPDLAAGQLADAAGWERLADLLRRLDQAGDRQTARADTAQNVVTRRNPALETHRRDGPPADHPPKTDVSPAGALPAAEAPRPPEVGSTLGRCILTEQVGRGATGVVFRALHQSLGIPVAVKVLMGGDLQTNERGLEQLATEARLLAQLNHPHIVRIWDFDRAPPFPYLVLEYVEGWSLAELIQHSGRLQPDRIVGLLAQVAAGLEAAQAIGVVHRDVKPANILVSRDGAAKLADLGLAVVVQRGRAAADGGGHPAGTAAYMAPEQVLGAEAVDHRADMYALGATLYHAVTGQIPFKGRSRLEVMLKHTQEAPRPPIDLVPEMGPGLSNFILRLMAKKPDDRFPTYAALLRELQTMAEGTADGGPTAGGRSFWQSLLSSLSWKKPGG